MLCHHCPGYFFNDDLGELNEHLLPETREQFYLRHSMIDDEDIIEWGSYLEPNPKPGSVQRKQLYTKAVRARYSPRQSIPYF